MRVVKGRSPRSEMCAGKSGEECGEDQDCYRRELWN